MRRLPFLFLASLLGLAASAAAAAPARLPNIVLIFADDLGWKDVGWQGSDFNETPNLDRLAQSGMVFSNAYAAAGNCAPSRACLLSGNYTPRHHVYAVQSTDRGPKNAMRLVPIPNRSGLAKDNVTVADALKAAGYATGIFGKWHLDGPQGAQPGEQGFDTVHQSLHTWSDAKADDPQNPKGIFSLTRGAMAFMFTCPTTRSTRGCRRGPRRSRASRKRSAAPSTASRSTPRASTISMRASGSC
jgi:arylsulfatase A-like enzyme